jgi:hypothetical protein
MGGRWKGDSRRLEEGLIHAGEGIHPNPVEVGGGKNRTHKKRYFQEQPLT